MWHRLFPRFCGRFYFRRLRVRGAEQLPLKGPVLWLGLHRNGAVDGFAYAAALHRPLVFMLSTQLRKKLLGRIFFGGIAVARNAEEGDRAANRAALDRCVALLGAGGELFVFPEGTSSLGPRHLPFKAGGAQLALDCLERTGGPLAVVPVGIHYDRAWAFRSDVEIVIGAPVDLALSADLAPLARLKEMKRRTTAALEAVGVNFPDETAQGEAEAIATFAARRLGRARWEVLQACERGAPAGVSAAWRELDAAATAWGTARYHGVPLLPVGWVTPARLLALVLPVGAGLALNFPPWLGAWWAARKMPDDRNVISFWKILAGLPLLALWSALVTLGCIATGAWGALLGYLALSLAAWTGYDALKRSAVETRNGLWHARALRGPTQALLRALEAAFPA
jgi:1-acyl-sn-glycerol-3-phosphate acyltransferase